MDKHWRAIFVDSDGDFVSTRPERNCDIQFERAGTVFACGQTAALVLYERYLHAGSCHTLHDQLLNEADDASVITNLTENLYWTLKVNTL